MSNDHTYEDIKIAFFGGEPLAVPALEALRERHILPDLIITNPDTPQGRKLILTPPPTKIWAEKYELAVFQPEKVSDPEVIKKLASENFDLFIVVAYGKILPEAIVSMPRLGTINVHPSLLPRFRGPSPIRSTILNDERETGVTIMKMDSEMDHGPIIAQEKVTIDKEQWPIPGRTLDNLLANAGARLLTEVLPQWIGGNCETHEQNHKEATFTKILTKEMGEIDLHDDPYQNLLKIRAFDGWPGTYFFTEKNGKKVRVKITDAELNDKGDLEILRVIPEGKKEMDFLTFTKS